MHTSLDMGASRLCVLSGAHAQLNYDYSYITYPI